MGKRIWIIGASAGIGAALARAYAAEGAELVLSARDVAALNALARQCGGAMVLPLDLAVTGDVARAVEEGALAGLDAVICTAAFYDPGRVRALDPEAVEKLVRVNLISAFEIARIAPTILRKGGQFVLFGSVAGYFGLPRGQAYSATKSAIINLAETLRIELQPDVDVRLVNPGFVRSRLTDKNDFDMPFIITAEEAARNVISGLRGKAFEIHFPKRFTWGMKILRALPYRLAFRLTRRIG